MKIEFGVPQGSILGPLLFLIYINDLPDATKFFIRLFADDTFLCAQNDDLWLLENEVNRELKNVIQWLSSNKLTLNISKSKYMMVSNKRNHCSLNIEINDEKLEECDSYKYLGVHIDKNLNWKSHINYVAKKVSKACGALAKARHCVDIDTLKTIYYALVNSYFRYGLVAWGNASYSALQPLNALNDRVLRIMSFAPLGRLDTSIIYEHLQILNIKKTFTLETCKFIFKSRNLLLPLETIATHFTRATGDHSYNTRSRSRNMLSIAPISFLSVFAQKSIQNRSAEAWACLPSAIQNAESFNIFKCALKKYLVGYDD